ncbi:hypothetical protein FBU59_005305 [Linderina macrospora]|uniref:Uncharacterized protein n=1 Tax=Linderina macrospora TaxID=4868 RepID=A0ACC1J387_9FUNG|nr:hypothetical protein FBU59_005305 [Linderina macrospora]
MRVYGEYISSEYIWLPSEFHIHADASVEIEPYINTLHPVKHKKMYPSITDIFARFVPTFENILTNLGCVDGYRVGPDKPAYKGGSWQIAGMASDLLIATSVYYYDVDNVTEGKLEFGEFVELDASNDPYDPRGFEQVYDVDMGGS